MKLYSYWRSTTSYRVRMALELKSLAYEIVPVDLVKGHQRESYATLNPSQGVPLLELDDGRSLGQSLAIIGYLDTLAEPRLVPEDPWQAAQVHEVALMVACDIHPVNNLKVVAKLGDDFNADKGAWMQHWMRAGFDALETRLTTPDPFAFGADVTVADLSVTAQLYNARRWGQDLEPYPKLTAIEAACLAMPAIARAAPDAQPDAPTTD